MRRRVRVCNNEPQTKNTRRGEHRPCFRLTDAAVSIAALDGLNLTIRAGEHTAILGPNGAGKSLLVRLLMHHERPVADPDAPSKVRVLGGDNWNVFDLWTQLGFVSSDLHHQFVNGNSEGQMTGQAAVLSAFLASQGILRYGELTDDMRRRTAQALDAAGAGHLALRRMNEMSSGEARRVLLARVRVRLTAAVLDEPTTGLDLVARHTFMERVRDIARTKASCCSSRTRSCRDHARDPAARRPDRRRRFYPTILTAERPADCSTSAGVGRRRIYARQPRRRATAQRD